MSKKLHVALVGLGFGSTFTEIYLRHPNVAQLTICDANPERLATQQTQFGVENAVSTLEAVLADPTIDAVHLNSGIPDHARQSVATLEAGKHCACTVPMATSLEEICAIIAAKRQSGKNYMMMETQLYAREFLFACELRDKGTFGRLQLLRGAHYQDMENWPAYWQGLPPMWYSTHAVAPCLAFAKTRALSVRCLGSGTMRDELKVRYSNPFPMETAIFRLDREGPLAMEITRALFHSARGYEESFTIYGEDATLEAPQIHNEAPVLFRLTALGAQSGPRRSAPEKLYVPDYAHLLPEPIRSFTGAVELDGRGEHPSVMHGGGHGGSHPHLIHEFVRSIVEQRAPAIDEIKAADWTAPGLCAHKSALRGGEEVTIPDFA
ncbi:glycosyl hydrolase family 109 protein 1 [Abditibacteriota bacterium]|nr:glycosyl hydrolase family 109 protein 1 [Abditibacteriota bacterium]